MNEVTMAHHGLILNHNDAMGFGKVFRYLPGRWDTIFRVTTGQFGIAAEVTLGKYGEIAELPRWA